MLDDYIDGIRRVHFIGIGGISMSALAKFLALKGLIVTGSDKICNNLTLNLSSLNIAITYSPDLSNVKKADLVVYNSAINMDDTELIFALSIGKNTISRAQLLKKISQKFNMKVGIAGSHGKTTVTALCTHILSYSKMNFTAHIGGLDEDFSNLYSTGEDVFLSEVCEYKQNIANFDADIALVLNVDNDHLDSYGTIDNLKDAFFGFLDKAETAIFNFDDKHLSTYSANKGITFGVNDGDIRCKNLVYDGNYYEFDVVAFGITKFSIKPKIRGFCAVPNVLAATAVATTLKIPYNIVYDGLTSFKGVKRRNEYLGKLNGAKVYADYAHHPSELNCVLTAFENSTENERLYVVFQPHTYSRTKLLFDDFRKVLIGYKHLYFYKTYGARENYDFDGSAEKLAENIGFSKYYDDIEKLIENLKNEVGDGDTVLVLGAGDLYDVILPWLD